MKPPHVILPHTAASISFGWGKLGNDAKIMTPSCLGVGTCSTRKFIMMLSMLHCRWFTCKPERKHLKQHPTPRETVCGAL